MNSFTRLNKLAAIFTVSMVIAPAIANAGVGTELVKKLASAATRKIGGEVTEQGGKHAVRKVIQQASVEVAEQAQKAGARTLLTKGGLVDEAANAAWRNKGVITGAVVLGTVATNPETVFAAGTDVVEAGVHASAVNIAQPLAIKTAEQIPNVLWGLLGIALAALAARYLHQRKKAKSAQETKVKLIQPWM